MTFDEDFLLEAHQRQQSGVAFCVIIFGRPTQLTIGQIIRDLHLLAVAGEPSDLENQVEYLPL